MRYVFGKLTDKSKQYWPMTIAGYVLDIIAVPALALVGEHGWIAACVLLVIGVLLYKETLHLTQVLGMLLCVAGLILVNR